MYLWDFHFSIVEPARKFIEINFWEKCSYYLIFSCWEKARIWSWKIKLCSWCGEKCFLLDKTLKMLILGFILWKSSILSPLIDRWWLFKCSKRNMWFYDLICYYVEWYFLFLGYGIFTCKDIKKKEFVVAYKGDLISSEEGEMREDKYNLQSTQNQEIGSFLYWFGKYW